MSNLRLASELLQPHGILGLIEPIAVIPGYFLNAGLDHGAAIVRKTDRGAWCIDYMISPFPRLPSLSLTADNIRLQLVSGVLQAALCSDSLLTPLPPSHPPQRTCSTP